MKPERLRVVLISVAAAVIGFNVWMYFTWPDLPLLPCKNTEVLRAASPNGRLEAVLFTRECASTRSVGSQVSVVEAGEPLANKSGNAFVSNGGDVRAAWGGPRAAIVWTGPSALTVSHDPTAEIYKAETEAAGAVITYQPE